MACAALVKEALLKALLRLPLPAPQTPYNQVVHKAINTETTSIVDTTDDYTNLTTRGHENQVVRHTHTKLKFLTITVKHNAPFQPRVLPKRRYTVQTRGQHCIQPTIHSTWFWRSTSAVLRWKHIPADTSQTTPRQSVVSPTSFKPHKLA